MPNCIPLPVEDYLCSVISSEMSATASLEFLKAHLLDDIVKCLKAFGYWLVFDGVRGQHSHFFIGEIVLQDIRTIRLKRSKQLLEKSQKQIAEIAYEVGFSSPKRFTINFKNEFGISPSDYIRSLK